MFRITCSKEMGRVGMVGRDFILFIYLFFYFLHEEMLPQLPNIFGLSTLILNSHKMKFL